MAINQNLHQTKVIINIEYYNFKYTKVFYIYYYFCLM